MLAEAVGPDRRASSRGRSPSPSSSGRRPSPRSRTCSAVSMPNARDLVRRSSRRRRSASRPRPRRRAPRAPRRGRVRAFVIVSSVVNVFEETTKSVSSGSRSRVASAKSVAVDVRDEAERQVAPRVVARAPRRPSPGPRSEPPMPMLTTLRIGLPVWPGPLARAHALGERRHPVEHLVDVGDDVAGRRRRATLALRHPQRDVEDGAVLGRR